MLGITNFTSYKTVYDNGHKFYANLRIFNGIQNIIAFTLLSTPIEKVKLISLILSAKK